MNAYIYPCKLLYKVESIEVSVLSYLANNLPSKIRRLDLGGNHISDHFLDTLIPKCSNLKSLALSFVKGISDRSLTTIIHFLKHSLEELDLNILKKHGFYVSLEKLIELKSMSKLQFLICSHEITDDEMKTLKKNLPQVKKLKTMSDLEIAQSEGNIWRTSDAKELKVFKANWDISD